MAKRKGEDGTASTSTKRSINKKDGTTSIKTYTIAEKSKILCEWDEYMKQHPKPSPEATAETSP